jgi:hypothetical protein
MAIIDRVKERTETDLTDAELQLMIDEANQDVIARFGPHADPALPITVRLEGLRKNLVVDRPIDINNPITVMEYITYYDWGETVITLDPLDYRIWPLGYQLQRLQTGPNPRSCWQDTVTIEYVPVNDGDQREEVIVKLVIIGIQFDAFSNQTVGDTSAVTQDYQQQRKSLLRTLGPRHGMEIA